MIELTTTNLFELSNALAVAVNNRMMSPELASHVWKKALRESGWITPKDLNPPKTLVVK